VGGGSVTQSISGLTTSLQTYSFGPEFSDLVAVHYTQGPSTTGEDDVIFDNVIVTAVPEPTSIALLGLGLAGLGFRKRKKLWSFSGQTGHADLLVLATMPCYASRP
jgi:hypothetical protein